MIRALPVVCALAFLLVVAAAAAGQGVTLRWGWEADRELLYDTEQSLSQRIDDRSARAFRLRHAFLLLRASSSPDRCL